MRQVILVAHNIRSAHNVGSLLRTAEGLGIEKVFVTGYSPHPLYMGDVRMPHEALKVARQIHKTALGAEGMIQWQFNPEINSVLKQLKKQDYSLCALEQSKHSVDLSSYRANSKIALLIGNEVTGLEADLLKKADVILEIPMSGKKESFNVVQAAAMALYHLCYT